MLAKTKAECAAKLKALKESILKEEPERPKADHENRIYQHNIPEVGQISLSHLTQSDLQQFYHLSLIHI